MVMVMPELARVKVIKTVTHRFLDVLSVGDDGFFLLVGKSGTLVGATGMNNNALGWSAPSLYVKNP